MADCALRNRIKQVAAKLQDLEGVAEVLAAGDVVPTVFEVTPGFDVSSFERQPFKSTLGREANITGTVTHNINMQLELKGAGVAGGKPNYSKFLLASGLAPKDLLLVTVSSVAGGPLAMGDEVTAAPSGARMRVFVLGEDPTTQLIAIPLEGTATAADTLSGPNGYSADVDAVDYDYGHGFEPYSKSTRCIPLDASAAYRDGEEVLGGTSGAVGEVIFIGDTHLWYTPISGTFASGETVTGRVSAAAANSTDVSVCCQPTPPLTMSVNQDGVQTVGRGMRGRVNFNFPAVGEPARMEFEFQGVLDSNPTDTTAFPEIADSLLPPKFQGADIQVEHLAATPFCPVMTSMNVQVDNTLSARTDAKDDKGIKSYLITNRDFSGAMDPELVAVADFEFHRNWFEDILKDFYMRIEDPTPVAGNIIELYMEELQFTNIDFGNRDDILTAETTFRAVQQLGDDAFKLVVR